VRRREALEMSLADTGLKVRVINNLEDQGILDVQTLAAQTREDLLAIENFGEKTLTEVCEVIDRLGIEHPDWMQSKPSHKAKRKR
jgi:DNA-directed RNA polymerase alpha subunit